MENAYPELKRMRQVLGLLRARNTARNRRRVAFTLARRSCPNQAAAQTHRNIRIWSALNASAHDFDPSPSVSSSTVVRHWYRNDIASSAAMAGDAHRQAISMSRCAACARICTCGEDCARPKLRSAKLARLQKMSNATSNPFSAGVSVSSSPSMLALPVTFSVRGGPNADKPQSP